MKSYEALKDYPEQPRFQRKWDPASHFCEDQELVGAPVHLVAPTRDQMIQSYHELIQDMSMELTRPFTDSEMKTIDYYVSKFIDSFLEEVKKLGSSSDVENFASLCKSRRNYLQTVTEFLTENNFEFYPQDLTVVTKLPNSEGSGAYSVDLKHMRYTPNNIYHIMMWLDKENLLFESVTVKEHPRFYIYLYRLLFEIILLFDDHQEGTGIRNRDIIAQMLLIPTGIGSIFEKLNPDVNLATSKMKEVIDMLKIPAKPLSEAFKEVLYQVLDDIKRGREPYSRQLGMALKRNFKISKFDFSDFYSTMKAAPQGIFQIREDKVADKLYLKPVYKFPSIVNSIIEIDPLSDYSEPYDFKVEYISNYRQLEDILNDPNFVDHDNFVYFNCGVMTIYVPNPGKFKGRVIHIACNAIQDRLNPVHHALEHVFKSYPCDCTYNHKAGIDFLKQETNPTYRESLRTKHNVFVSDFSNATDTLSQEFQEIVISELLDDKLAALWHDISCMKKVAVYPDGTWEEYTQVSGQPQGIICSFDFFSLAHHVLLLMVMKLTNNSDMLASDFYRILGDDSIVAYPLHNDNNVLDAYQVHSWLCQEVNLIKNDSKTGKSFYREIEENAEPDKVILDFAKISVFEGEFCSSLPAGLGLNYIKEPKMSKLSVLIWYAEQGLAFPRWAHSVISDLYLSDHTAFIMVESIMFGGTQQFLKVYEDPDLIKVLDPCIVGFCNYLYSLERLSRGYFGFFFSDTIKKKIYERKYDFDNIDTFLQSDIRDSLLEVLPNDHKYNQLYDNNIWMASLVDLLYEGEDSDKESLFGMLLAGKADPNRFVDLISFNSLINLELQNHDYNFQDFYMFDPSYYFGEDGFHEKTIHTIKGGRERGDAVLFKNCIKQFKEKTIGNDKFSLEKEKIFRDSVLFIGEKYFGE